MKFIAADFDPTHDYRITFNGADIPVLVESDDGTVSAQQLEALAQALALAPDVLELSAPAVVQNYDVYYEMIGDDDELPPLTAPMDVWKSVHPSEIIIPPHDAATPPSFLLMAECDWDTEHGLVVRFRNGIADESDQQGEMGIND